MSTQAQSHSSRTDSDRWAQNRAALLPRIAGSGGAICGLALDHRDALRNAFERAGVSEVDEGTMLEVKRQILEVLAGRASMLLLDPPSVARDRCSGAPILVPLERQGHEPQAGGRLTRLLEDFTPRDAAVLGAVGCKLLLYYRADHPVTAAAQLELAGRVAAECHRHGLLLVVEPIIYRLEDEDEPAYARGFGELIVCAANDLAEAGADLLKLQFPGTDRACKRVSDACAPLPWMLLGGGEVDGQTFAEELQIACASGASGFLAGRAIWGGALALAPTLRRVWLEKHALPLFERLIEISETNVRRIS